MKLDPTDRLPARLAAQSIVRNGFRMKEVVAELRPDLKTHSYFAARLLADPVVRTEVEKIMSRTERNAARYKDKMWDWLDAPVDGLKETEENRRTAARILAKPYLDPKMKSPQEQGEAFKLEGLNSETEAALMGKKVQ